MAQRPRRTAESVRASEEQQRSWHRSLRISGIGAVTLALVLLGIVVLAPNVSQLIAQRQEIAEVTGSNAVDQAELESLQAERERWGDATFVASQARDRLYYVKPGEISFIVIDDIPRGSLGPETETVSGEVEQTEVSWTRALLGSVISSAEAETRRGE